MRKNESGQALVLVLLSLSVVLTIVLFILSRSVTDISVSSREGESVRAFSAAEAGIEKALVVGTNSGTTASDTTFNAQVSGYADAATRFNYPLSLSSGESATTWFVAHDDQGNIVCSGAKPCFTGDSMKVCWGSSGTSSSTATTPAAEVSIFYTTTPGDYRTLKIARVALDPNAGRRASNSFTAPDSSNCDIDGTTYAFGNTITFSSLGIPNTSYLVQGGLQFARIRFIYNTSLKHKFGIDTFSNALPSQGLLVDSTGVSGESNRRLEVFQGWPEAPSVLDFAIYSSSGLTKN